jgi:hypothetical protein
MISGENVEILEILSTTETYRRAGVTKRGDILIPNSVQ